MRNKYTAIVIGSGPAGIFASRELDEAGIETLLIEKGKPASLRKCPMTEECYHCVSCHEIEGVGGAGGYSDGKLCNGPVGITDEMIGTTYGVEVDYVNQVFLDTLGEKYQPSDDTPFSCSVGRVSEEITKVVFLGTSNVRQAFQMLYENLTIDKMHSQRVTSVRFIDGEFVVRTKLSDEFKSKYLLVATGKCDFSLRPQLISSFGLRTLENFPTFGVRLEVPKEQLAKIKAKGHNPKIKKFYRDDEYVKTHCFCYEGEVMAYVCGPYFLVGGRSGNNQTPFANISILYRRNAKETTSLVMETLRGISRKFPNNVICQDVNSFIGGSDNSKLRVKPCRGEVFGDLTKLYPDEILYPLQDFIITLMEKGELDISGGLVHGPSAEWINPNIDVSFNGESPLRGLFFIGDTSGKTQGIVAATVTGVRAAREIIYTKGENYGKQINVSSSQRRSDAK